MDFFKKNWKAIVGVTVGLVIVYGLYRMHNKKCKCGNTETETPENTETPTK